MAHPHYVDPRLPTPQQQQRQKLKTDAFSAAERQREELARVANQRGPASKGQLPSISPDEDVASLKQVSDKMVKQKADWEKSPLQQVVTPKVSPEGDAYYASHARNQDTASAKDSHGVDYLNNLAGVYREQHDAARSEASSGVPSNPKLKGETYAKGEAERRSAPPVASAPAQVAAVQPTKPAVVQDTGVGQRAISTPYGQGSATGVTQTGQAGTALTNGAPNWQQDIVRKFPQIGILDSAQNIAFRQAYQKNRLEGPGAMAMAEDLSKTHPAFQPAVAVTNEEDMPVGDAKPAAAPVKQKPVVPEQPAGYAAGQAVASVPQAVGEAGRGAKAAIREAVQGVTRAGMNAIQGVTGQPPVSSEEWNALMYKNGSRFADQPSPKAALRVGMGLAKDTPTPLDTDYVSSGADFGDEQPQPRTSPNPGTPDSLDTTAPMPTTSSVPTQGTGSPLDQLADLNPDEEAKRKVAAGTF